MFRLFALLLLSSQILLHADTIGTPETVVLDGPSKAHRFDIGAGFGIDYGGIFGAKFTVKPIPYFSLFGAAGYYLVGVGWSAGVQVNILPAYDDKLMRLYLQAMYGSNGATMIIGASEYNEVFYGFTPGAGLGFRFGSSRQHGFDVLLNFPIHSSEFDQHVARIKSDSRVVGFNEPLPVAFSFSYHFEF